MFFNDDEDGGESYNGDETAQPESAIYVKQEPFGQSDECNEFTEPSAESAAPYEFGEPTERSKFNKGWRQEEDELLIQLCDMSHPNIRDWKEIAAHFQSPIPRSEYQCQQRWEKVLNPDLIKGPWTKMEDTKLIELVNRFGQKRWSLIAKHLRGRLGKQCRERWHNQLNPDIKKTAWTDEEDRLICELHARMGNKWVEIARHLPGRSENSVKNRWNSALRKRLDALPPQGSAAKKPKTYAPIESASLPVIAASSVAATPRPLPLPPPLIGPFYSRSHLCAIKSEAIDDDGDDDDDFDIVKSERVDDEMESCEDFFFETSSNCDEGSEARPTNTQVANVKRRGRKKPFPIRI